MVDLLTWTIAAFALSWVIADAKISLPFRNALDTLKQKRVFGAGALLMLVECVACSGAHVGWIGQLLGVAPFKSWWMAGLYTCGSNLLLAKWLGMLDETD